MNKSKSMAKFDAEKVLDACASFINDNIKKMDQAFDDGARLEYDKYVKKCNKSIFNWIIKVIFRLKCGSELQTAKIEPMCFEEFQENWSSHEMRRLRFERQKRQTRRHEKILYVGKIFTMVRHSSGDVFLTPHDAEILFPNKGE